MPKGCTAEILQHKRAQTEATCGFMFLLLRLEQQVIADRNRQGLLTNAGAPLACQKAKLSEKHAHALQVHAGWLSPEERRAKLSLTQAHSSTRGHSHV